MLMYKSGKYNRITELIGLISSLTWLILDVGFVLESIVILREF